MDQLTLWLRVPTSHSFEVPQIQWTRLINQDSGNHSAPSCIIWCINCMTWYDTKGRQFPLQPNHDSRYKPIAQVLSKRRWAATRTWHITVKDWRPTAPFVGTAGWLSAAWQPKNLIILQLVGYENPSKSSRSMLLYPTQQCEMQQWGRLCYPTCQINGKCWQTAVYLQHTQVSGYINQKSLLQQWGWLHIVPCYYCIEIKPNNKRHTHICSHPMSIFVWFESPLHLTASNRWSICLPSCIIFWMKGTGCSRMWEIPCRTSLCNFNLWRTSVIYTRLKVDGTT